MDLEKDSNHTFRYFYLKSKRSYRDNVKPYTYELWIALVDLINAAAKMVLGFMATLFGLAEEICLKSQSRWANKTETVIKEGSVHKVN